MPQELSFADRILGGSAQEAISDIRRSIDDPDQLNTLLGHELSHMNRVSVVKVIEARLKKANRQNTDTGKA